MGSATKKELEKKNVNCLLFYHWPLLKRALLYLHLPFIFIIEAPPQPTV